MEILKVEEQGIDFKNTWGHSAEEVCQQLKSSISEGLSDGEAKKRLQETGFNELPEKKSVPAWKIFLKQFNSFIIWILFAAAFISGFLAEWVDAVAISVIIFLNAILGFVQEYHAEKSIAALRKLSTPTSKVIRGGALQVIPSREIVPGDLLLLEQGDRIPADGRIIKSYLLQTQEAALTGESMPSRKRTELVLGKQVSLGDRNNMVFMGTSVAYGKGYAVATATGSKTELGNIASLLEANVQEKTPLEQKLEELGMRLVFLFLSVVVIVFILGVFRGNDFLTMFMVSLSLAVAAIPEGLPAVVTIAPAFGVKKMAKRNALIRRLASVETLGCATVICTDKTGTLTKNEMTVRDLWVNQTLIKVTGSGYEPFGDFIALEKNIDPKEHDALMLALKIGGLCNGAKLSQVDGTWQVTGDPTEGALLVLAEKAGCKKEQLEQEHPLLEELPFDSERKRMSVLRKTPEGTILFVKGAPDIILELSDKVWIHGKETELGDVQRKLISGSNHRFAAQALRVLAVAYKKMLLEADLHPAMEKNLTFVGLIAMMDSPRTEAKAAIETCKRAGIRPVMITGDHKETAAAIAKELGLMEKGDRAINGVDIDQMDTKLLQETVRTTSVYARVSAEHKLKIVQALRANGEIVAMTGDGVNDAPAIKEANIGIAMGITGTDVTKEASDMVITDDNFASIVHAVEEGRGIYDNILKFVNYLLSSNLAEIFVLFLAMLFDFKDGSGNHFVPLTAVQILWMNLVTDGFPALALSMDPLDPKAMERLPRNPKEPILPFHLFIKLLLVALIIALGALTSCLAGLKTGPAYAQSMTLSTLIVLQFIRVQMVRSSYHVPLFSNPWLIAALTVSFLFQLALLYVPFLQNIFGTVALDMHEWGIIALISGMVWVLGKGANSLVDFVQTKGPREG